MNRVRARQLLLLGLVLVAPAGAAEVERGAPRGSAAVSLSGVRVTVDYGRPLARGRKIFGGLVPFDRIWRLGADEATVLRSEGDLLIGDLRVSAGTYALFVLPSLRGWKLVVNRVAEQWGAYNYDPTQDVGRVAMAVAVADAPVEQLTVTLEPTAEREATLRVSWERVTASIALRVEESGPPAPGS